MANQAGMQPIEPPKLARSDLIYGRREDYLNIDVPLYEASIKCDWNAAKAIFDRYPERELVRCRITENGETSLHLAASALLASYRYNDVEKFVKNLVDMMTNDDLELQNKDYNTALYLAAVSGNIKVIKIITEKNRTLLTVAGDYGKMMPLCAAAFFGNVDTVKYLYNNSMGLHDAGWTDANRGWLLEQCLENDMFDVALEIVKTYPGLCNGSALGLLARKPEAFPDQERLPIISMIMFISNLASNDVGTGGPSESNIIKRTIKSTCAFMVRSREKDDCALQLLRIIWGEIVKKSREEIDDIVLREPEGNTINTYSSHILFVAAEMGNTKFVVELIRQYPELIWKVNDDNQTIFHIAVKHRHVGIYNLLYEIGSMRDLISSLKDQKQNNMLHLVGMGANGKQQENVWGAAIEMQEALLWFQEVRAAIPACYRKQKNRDGLTPQEIFSKEHKDLLKEGEKWMKYTASQCIVVAALIATIVFAAAFTVPGGYDQEDGIPTFHSQETFIVFVIADAISLFMSTTSILVFLNILMARFSERDFLETLPQKLMIGLSTLFISVVTMAVTFSISFFILYRKNLLWMPIFISVFAVYPVILFVSLQYRMLLDVLLRTFRSKFLFKPYKQILYYNNPKF